MVAAAITMLVSCTVEDIVSSIDGLDVSTSYVSVSADGGSATVNVNSDQGWTSSIVWVDSSKDWLTVTPSSASAGQSVTINFTASENKSAERKAEVKLILDNGQVKVITVAQGGGEPAPSTCKEVINGDDGAAFKVTGVITKIVNTHYGNWYINDGTGEVYIYGTCDKKGNTNSSSNSYDNINDASYENSWELSVGDQVTIQGPKTTYNGTVELVDVTILDIQKSLIKCDSLSVSTLPIEGGQTVAALMCKGNGVNVTIPEDAKRWLSVTGINPTENGFDVTFEAQPNNEGDRTTTLIFKTTDGTKDYSAEVELSQKGAIIDASVEAFNSAPVGSTMYRVSGMVTTIANTKYGNFYIRDYSGETYIYGIDDFANSGIEVGDIVTLVGKRGVYNTTIEMLDAVLESKIDVTEISIAEFLAVEKSKDIYYRLTGTITEIAKADYGNLYIKDEAGNEVYVYGVYSGYGATGDARKGLIEKEGIEVGDILTVEGYKDVYNGTIELCGGIYVKHEKPAAPQEEGNKSIADINAAITSSSDEPFSATVTGAIVTYVNGNNAFIEDATGGIQLYMKEHGLKVGQKIDGEISGTAKVYAKYVEMTSIDLSKATVTDGATVPVTTLTLSALLADYYKYQNMCVKLEGVTVTDGVDAESDRDGKISQGDATIAIRSQVKGSIAIEAGATGDLICWPSRYNDNLQLGVWDNSHFTVK